MRERITAHNSRQEKTVSHVELQQSEWSVERESLLRANNNLLLSVEKLTRENRELKEKTVPPTRFNLKLLLAGILSGFFIGILLMLHKK